MFEQTFKNIEPHPPFPLRGPSAGTLPKSDKRFVVCEPNSSCRIWGGLGWGKE